MDGAAGSEPLAGGTHQDVRLVTAADGSRRVVKTAAGAPAGMFEAEAEGLATLRATGTVVAPAVLAVGPGSLELEVLRPAPAFDDTAFWAEAGRRVALLHGVTGDRFGWHADNWLGPGRQYNPWREDGYAFFAEHRVLRYLREPRVAAALDAGERAAVERICTRLPDLVPPTPPVLTHGDLWPGNVLATAAGVPAVIDPAVSFSWAGTDVSMMLYAGRPAPAVFFAGYHEARPPEPGWRDHYAVLHLREVLCLLSQGNIGPDLIALAHDRLDTTLHRFG